MKKLLAITLTLVMILGTISISASAMSTSFFFNFEGNYSADGNYAYDVLDNGTISVVSYLGDEKEIVIPETIDGYTVSLVSVCFGNADREGKLPNLTLDKITYPSTAKTVSLINLLVKEIVVPEGVKSIWLHSVEVEKINIPEGVTSLYLRMCDHLKELDLPKSLTVVNESGLPFGCGSLEKVTVQPNSTVIHDDAFDGSSKNITFYGYKNSYIEDYTQRNGYKFESIGIFGDVNQDGSFNGKDVLELRKSIIGLESSIDEYNSDVNFDGKINGKDVLAIRKQLVGLTSYLGEDTEPDDTTPVETPSYIVVEIPDNV